MITQWDEYRVMYQPPRLHIPRKLLEGVERNFRLAECRAHSRATPEPSCR